MHPAYIHYLELRGEQAQATLQWVAQQLRYQAGFIDAALLFSQSQGLWLLESRWHTQPPAYPWPQEAKAWAFAVQEYLERES